MSIKNVRILCIFMVVFGILSIKVIIYKIAKYIKGKMDG